MKNKIFIAVFLIITLALYPVYRLTYNMWDHTNYENRNYTTVDDIKKADIYDKSGVIDSFINDNVPFKNELTGINAWINLKIFGTVQSSEVLLGKEGWLFHKNAHDSAAIDDYQGLNPYSEQQLAQLTAKLVQLENTLALKGIEFKVIIPPNKEQVYSRYMPDNIPVLGKGRVQLMAEYINANCEVQVIYPLDEFRTMSESENIYYKYDTHWNNLGAVKGINLILDGFENYTATVTEQKPLMDLANVSGIYNFVELDEYYDVKADTQHIGQNLYLLHDSFGDMMKPILSQRYNVSDATFAYFADFSLPADTDVFVIEITERYIYRLYDTIDRIIENAESI